MADKDLLYSRIRILNERVWEERAKAPAIERWLKNFTGGASEEFMALYLLSQFMYFGDREIRELLKALFRDLYRYPIVSAVREAEMNTRNARRLRQLFNRELNTTRFLGVGNPAESGTHLLYFFRQVNGLPLNHFISAHQIFPSRNQKVATFRDRRVSRFVFLDDFCGSGVQAIVYTRELVRDIRRAARVAGRKVSVSYYAVFGTEAGLEAIRSRVAFDDVAAVMEFDPTYACFHADSRYFREQPPLVDRAACEAMCRHYGGRLVPASPLGFDDGQLLLGFHHNTPDNTLPIIWFDEPDRIEWSPIFRRYPKKYLWAP